MVDLVKRLEIMSGMITMGEKIAWGSDAALMDEARAEIERLREALKPFSEFAFAPLIEDETKFVLVECTTSGPYADLVPIVKAGDIRRAAALIREQEE